MYNCCMHKQLFVYTYLLMCATIVNMSIKIIQSLEIQAPPFDYSLCRSHTSSKQGVSNIPPTKSHLLTPSATPGSGQTRMRIDS